MMEVSGTLLNQFDTPESGNAAAFLEVEVYRLESNGDESLATLYLENSTTGPERDNPFLSGPAGRYSFFVEDGIYELRWNSGLSKFRVQAFDLARLQDAARDLEVVRFSGDYLLVNGTSHSKWYILDNSEAPEILVAVSKAVIPVGGEGATMPVPGTVVLFTCQTDVVARFISDIPGVVEVKSPADLRPFGKWSTVALMASGENEWFLAGDINTWQSASVS